MSIGSFFKSAEQGVEKVVGFIVKEMTAAENLLGAKTGSVKANIVITAVEGALAAMGVEASSAQKELQLVLDALTALFNKLGLFQSSS
jgi:hypothetical protein